MSALTDAQRELLSLAAVGREAIAIIDERNERVRVLTDALHKYGEHTCSPAWGRYCNALAVDALTHHRWHTGQKCTCGLDNLRGGPRRVEAP